MKKFRQINCYTTLLVASFLLLSFPLQSIDRNEAYILSSELHEVLENNDKKYVCLGKEFSNLYEVMSRIRKLDDNDNSLISELQEHMLKKLCKKIPQK